MSRPVEQKDIKTIAHEARAAARALGLLSDARRREILSAVADEIEQCAAVIVAANKSDLAAAQGEVDAGRMRPAMFDRLRASERGVGEMAARVREVAALDDPLGRVLSVTELDDDLTLTKVSCPLGVVGVVFEARPEVIPQVAALAFKSGNAVLLKGGREATQTNEALFTIWREVFSHFPEVLPAAINLLRSREEVGEMLALDEDIDLIVPRGSKEFVREVSARSHIPVLGHGEGLCHIYVDRAANLSKAAGIIIDAKTQYPAACNAAETLLIHRDVAAAFAPEIIARLRAANVEVRGCARTRALDADVKTAHESDWATEYSDLIISVKIIADLDHALAHIAEYGSKHTEAIVTEDAKTAARFLAEVDAAGVYHNVSTRFADGYRYGLGAEVGISTSKLHARGPVGLEGLTTYKYKLQGDGHTVASYASGVRKFKHRKRG